MILLSDTLFNHLLCVSGMIPALYSSRCFGLVFGKHGAGTSSGSGLLRSGLSGLVDQVQPFDGQRFPV